MNQQASAGVWKAPEPQSPSIAASAEFRALVRAKRRFIVPASIFFIAYYFTLPLLVGYAPSLMETRVVGPLNLAYLFALSQFFMAWALALLYVRVAARWDRAAHEITARAVAAAEGRRGDA